jgi:hypothetical protein
MYRCSESAKRCRKSEINGSRFVDTYPVFAFGGECRIAKKGRFDGLVIIAKDDPPVPIPNTTVKPFSADGTKSQGLGE